MTSADIVIGANFGDEGKGLITDFLSAPHGRRALVVRFNGGAQAGHTVVTPGEGHRHDFGHHGSGSFIGAATFLSRFFVCNPLLFVKERNKLASFSCRPDIYIDARCPVTTHYDMMINQIAEELRDTARHGSCGVGFGETVERHRHESFGIVYADLADTDALKKKLRAIGQDWVPRRLKALGIDTISDIWQQRLASGGVLQKFLDDTQQLLSTAHGVDAHFLRDTDKHIVFEGAQGLLLDQDHGWFPHVTRSHTGLRNVSMLAKEAGISHLKTTYITRAYLTRHGAGPLPQELAQLPYPRITDATNKPNDYQGTLRFAWLDADLLAKTITQDVQHANGLTVEYGLAVTCLDQVDGRHTFLHGGKEKTTGESEFLETLKEAVGAQFLLTSHGPTREDVARR